MKEKKNLERAIVLGLILSTGVYGSAWAAEVGPIHNANYNNDSNHGSPYNEDVNVTSDNIGNIILEDDRQYTVTITTTGEGNDINLTTDGVGIQLADKIEAGTKVTLSADGDIIINAKKDGIQGNASARYENNVSTITLNAQNNRITATETAVYGLGKVDIELTADKDNVIVATGNDYAVKTDANSAGILNITAQDGNNIIMAEKGTAIRANGNKVITIKANNEDDEDNGNNIIIGKVNGIQHNEEGDVGEGETLVKDANTKYVIIEGKNNVVYGGENGILSDGTGIVKVTANESNTIGQYSDESNVTHTSNTGINVTEGTVDVTAGGSNIIKATDTGIYAENSSSKVYLNSIENNIISVNNSGNLPHESGAIGLYAADGARIINDDNKITGRVEVDAETINGNAFGLQARENGKINFKTNDLEIRAVHSGQAGGETVGIYAGYGVTSSTQEQTSKSNIEIVSEGGIEINALQNGSKVNTGAMAYGVKGNNAGSITLTAKNNDVNIFAGQLENTESITNNSFGVAAYNNSDVTINTEVGSIKIITGVTYDENGKAIIDGANNQGVYVNGLEKGQAATAQVTLDSKNDINIITASKSQGTQHGAIFVAGNGIADIYAGNNITLNASNESSSGKTYGVSIASVNDKIYLDAGGTIDIDVSSGQAIGVSAQKGTAELNAKNVEINSYGKSNSTSAQGIASGSGAKLYLGAISDIAISAQGNAYATGIYTNGNNSYTEIESDKLKVLADNLGKGFGSSNAAYGIWGKDDNKTQITTNNLE